MTESTMPQGVDPNSVRKVMGVQAPQAVAWRVFTKQMGVWWPLAYYKIGKANAVDAVIEPYVGGRWYERGDDDSTCHWGSVLAWEPPSRLVLSWDISADWQYDPNLKTEPGPCDLPRVESPFVEKHFHVRFKYRRPRWGFDPSR